MPRSATPSTPSHPFRHLAVPEHPFLYRNLPGTLIRRLHQRVVQALTNGFADAGTDLTPVQHSVLSGVFINPGIDQGKLAELVGYDRATVGAVIDRLEKKGLLRRAVSPADRRARQLQVLPPGEAWLRSVEPAIVAAQLDLLAPLTDAERVELQRLLQKLVLRDDRCNNDR